MNLRVKGYRLVLISVATCLLLGSATAHPGAGIAVDRLGQVYFLDTGSGLWKIDARGGLTHLSALKNHWLALDANNGFAGGRLPTDPMGDWVITRVGVNPTLLISTDFPIAIGQDGNLYYPSGRPGHLQLMRATPSGDTSVVATLPLAVTGQPLQYIGALIAGPDGSLYYTEDTAIKRITSQGVIGTVITISAPARPPSIPATDQHPYLRGLAVDARGVMYVADTGDARVLRITPRGEVTTLLQTQSPWAPTAVAVYGNDVYVLEFLHTTGDVRRDWLPRVRRIAANGKSKIVATIDNMPGAR